VHNPSYESDLFILKEAWN